MDYQPSAAQHTSICPVQPNPAQPSRANSVLILWYKCAIRTTWHKQIHRVLLDYDAQVLIPTFYRQLLPSCLSFCKQRTCCQQKASWCVLKMDDTSMDDLVHTSLIISAI